MVKVATQLVQGTNGSEDDRSGAVVAPLHFSTAFRHPGLGESTGYDYSRMTTPTRDLLEAQLAKIEHGTQAFAVRSGMAAITLVLSTILKSHDHMITLLRVMIYMGAHFVTSILYVISMTLPMKRGMAKTLMN